MLSRRGIGGMDLGLQNKVYRVTGDSRGLGFAAAEALIAEGARTVLSSPRESTASAAAGRLADSVERAPIPERQAHEVGGHPITARHGLERVRYWHPRARGCRVSDPEIL